MLEACFAALVIALVLGISEFLWRRGILKGEISRKFVHILTGVFIAFLPFWVSYNWIVVLAVGFIAVNVFNHLVMRIFKHPRYRRHANMGRVLRVTAYITGADSVTSVQRKTWGDILFGLAVLICAVAHPPAWIFAAAVLQVAIADGLAAVVGVTLGKHHGVHYKVFGSPKTFLGTWTFVMASFFILVMAVMANPTFIAPTDVWPVLVYVPMLLAVIENVGVYGLDNLLLPVTTLLLLCPLCFRV